jgi:hypothetical protein
LALAGLASVALIFASSAFAASGYGKPGGGVAGDQTGGGGGNLPFTGAELLLYVVVGLAIVASGFALRALSTRHTLD